MGPAITREDITSLFVKDFIEAQNAAGLTPVFLATALKRLLNAKKTEVFKSSEDSVVYSKPLPDHATRRLALQMALNIRGVQTTSPTSVTNINDAKEVNIMGAVHQALTANGDDVDD